MGTAIQAVARIEVSFNIDANNNLHVCIKHVGNKPYALK
jgi:molecular chaperone DnaK (HSP70)